jgi:predicted RNase H-like nuclease
MKKTKENLEHRIQLKKDEIQRYADRIKNYPADRMERNGKPYLQKLQNDLTILENELDNREGRRELKAALGYARIGLNNV